MLTVHLPFAARLVPHVVAETAKSPVVQIAIPVRSADWFIKTNLQFVFSGPLPSTA
jgi:hypothetical protein